MKEQSFKALRSENLVGILEFLNTNKISREDVVQMFFVNGEYTVVYYGE